MSQLLSFIDYLEQQEKRSQDMDKLKNLPGKKIEKLNSCRNEAREKFIREILIKFMANSVPVDDECKLTDMDEIKSKAAEFIDTHDTVKYVYETKDKSKKIKDLVDKSHKVVDAEYRDKSARLSELSVEDLNYTIGDDEEKKIDRISEDLELDDLSELIKDNVKATTIEEIERAKHEEMEKEELEEQLAADDSIDSEEALEKAIARHNMGRPKTYIPSIFEAVLSSKMKYATESTDAYQRCLTDAIMEYAFISASHSLGIKEIDKPALIKEYAKR